MAVNWSPLWLSLRVAAIATLISLVIGLCFANLLAHRQFRGKHWVEAAVSLPLVLPPTVIGYYLLVLLGRSSPLGQLYTWAFGSPLVFTWQAAVVASTLSAIPLLVKSTLTVFQRLELSHGRAARNLGAAGWRVFWRITLPLARRAVATAGLLAFARALGEFGITLMIAGSIPGQTQTAAVAIYSAEASGDTLLARLLVLALSAIVLGLFFAAHRLEQPQVSG
jgi:molybdate transport system permease protein